MIKEEKLVSIIMSAYNSENTIIDSIESLLNQTYKNIEILIVDDCSVDKTYEICEHYEKKNKPPDNLNTKQLVDKAGNVNVPEFAKTSAQYKRKSSYK